MKFRKGQRMLNVPHMSEILEAKLVFAGGAEVRLSVVHMEQIQSYRKRFSQETAWPTMAALALGASEVHVWPTPHRAGELVIKYYPPAKEV